MFPTRNTQTGERFFTLSDDTGYFAPALIAGISLSGLTRMKKGEYSTRITKNSLIEVSAEDEVVPINAGKTVPLSYKVSPFSLNHVDSSIISEFEQRGVLVMTGVDSNTIFGPPPDKVERRYYVNAREVRARISLYLDAMHRPRLHMVTISFPPQVTEALAARFRNAWETAMRKKGILKDFLWITEFQQNGTPHFHFAVFGKVPVREANRLMQSILRKAVKDGLINYPKNYINRYNGVDLQGYRDQFGKKRVTNFGSQRGALVKYLTKYILKGSKDKEFNGFAFRAWGCSKALSNLCKRLALTVAEYERMLKLYEDQLVPVAIENEDLAERIDFFRWKDECPKEIRDLLSVINQGVIIQANYLRRNRAAYVFSSS